MKYNLKESVKKQFNYHLKKMKLQELKKRINEELYMKNSVESLAFKILSEL